MGAVAWNKPLPRPTAASQPFWDGLRRHQVRLQQCEDCGQWIFYPRLHCPQCASRRLAWREVSGEGTLYTFTVATLPEFSDELPQRLAVVALDEGPHINTTLVGVEPDELRVGLRLRPVFDDRPVSFTLLRYTPAASSHPGVINAVPLQAELSAPPAPPPTLAILDLVIDDPRQPGPKLRFAAELPDLAELLVTAVHKIVGLHIAQALDLQH